MALAFRSRSARTQIIIKAADSRSDSASGIRGECSVAQNARRSLTAPLTVRVIRIAARAVALQRRARAGVRGAARSCRDGRHSQLELVTTLVDDLVALITGKRIRQRQTKNMLAVGD